MNWNANHQKSFEALKIAVTKTAVLAYPHPNIPYKLYTDASDIGIGAVLTQDDENQNERPICFLSRKLQNAELNYPTVEKELLAVVYAFRKLRKYLLEKPFTLFTDNNALRYIFTKSEPSGRLHRWILTLQEYPCTVKHILGKKNIIADIMSRYPPQTIELENDFEFEDPLRTYYLEYEKSYEENLALIIDYLYDPNNFNNMYAKIREQIKKKSYNFRLINNKLHKKYRENFLYVPRINERVKVLEETHNGHGHFGRDATFERIRNKYWWPNVYQSVKDYLKNCHLCQIFDRAKPPQGPIFPLQINSLFERFGLDFVGPLPMSKAGNKYLLVCTKYYTRWPIVKATKFADSDVVSKFLYEEVFCIFGPPQEILTDGGSHFRNEIVKKFCEIVQTRHKFSSPYHPRTNGLTEKLNHTLICALRKTAYHDPDNWDEFVPSVTYAYRTKIHKILGLTPYELMFGVPPRQNDVIQNFGIKLGFERLLEMQDIRENANEKLCEAQRKLLEKREYNYDIYECGQKVLLRRSAKDINRTGKMEPKWYENPHQILQIGPHNTYQLRDYQGRILKRYINGDRLKRYHDSAI